MKETYTHFKVFSTFVFCCCYFNECCNIWIFLLVADYFFNHITLIGSLDTEENLSILHLSRCSHWGSSSNGSGRIFRWLNQRPHSASIVLLMTILFINSLFHLILFGLIPLIAFFNANCSDYSQYTSNSKWYKFYFVPFTLNISAKYQAL